MLEPLKYFDWTTKTSPLATLGGMKGVNEAHRILSETLNYFLEETPGIQSPKLRKLDDFSKKPI